MKIDGCATTQAANRGSVTPVLSPVQATDFDAMVVLRIDALRPSLERLGRFDPSRARQRLAEGFAPAHMQHIEVAGERIGFVTLQAHTPAVGKPALRLNHLYIRPGSQGLGVGAWVLNWAKGVATQQAQDITLSALKLSDANRFYLRHGFVLTGSGDFDNEYRWSPDPATALCDD